MSILNNWLILSDFVKSVTVDRDPSHGYEHMERVATIAFDIAEAEVGVVTETNYRIHLLCIIVGWLHDVNDHKYHNYNNEVLLNQFLESHYPEDKDLILKIIDRISFSKEANKTGPLDWNEVLGEEGCLVRNIVSDADKLEAIGSLGIKRCMEYSAHSYKNKYGVDIPRYTLLQTVITHANEKLLHLKDQFIRTNEGKRLAESLNDNMVAKLDKLKKELNESL